MTTPLSDVRTLLLTDVVDSTRLSEALGEVEIAAVWAGHDRAARDLLQLHNGREIDKTDGMLMLFDSVAHAVDYALAYHRALAVLPVPLKARAGIHLGAVVMRENSAADVALGAKSLEVDGVAKPIAARVMSLARGGQTLLSANARAALGATEYKVESHGHWIVKGVAEPIECFEIGDPAARFIAPNDTDKAFRVVRAAEWWLPVRDIPNNLPHQATSFVGRATELDDLKVMLEKVRLITVLGMGGLGKTRLCLQAAAELMHSFPDGVWFLDFAPLRDPSLVVNEAAQVLAVKAEPGRSLAQSVCAHLRTRRALIVLDNCEHLVDACAEFASAILQAAPHVRMLASSREALRVAGEQSYPLRPLKLPSENAGIEELSASPAVQLFVDRAREHKPSFVFDARQGNAVAELVARLEGIPLALELAAARVRALSVADINLRLKDRYKLLTGGGRALQQRQQTLRALVDWSYELLKNVEQTLLCRLSVFVGGFDLSSAEEVCGTEPLASDEVLDQLGSLVEKSLVTPEEGAEGTRYRMLETIREYAAEKLEQRGENGTTNARYCEYFFVRAKQARDGMLGPQQAEWIVRTEADLDNIRRAIALALAGAVDPLVGVKMLVALHGFWELRGYATEGRNLIGLALALPAVQQSDFAHAFALYVGGGLAESQSDHRQAIDMLEQCLALRRRLGDPIDIAATLSTLSLARLGMGDAIGAAQGEREALRVFQEQQDRNGEAIGLLHLGQIGLFRGELEQAQQHLERCLEVARAIEDQEVQGECELVLGQLEFERGQSEAAELWFKRSLTLCREAADKKGQANALWWLGKCDVLRGEMAGARARLSDALRTFSASEMWEETLGCLQDFVDVLAGENRDEQAVQVLAAHLRARERLGLFAPPRTQHQSQAQSSRLMQRMTQAAFDHHQHLGGAFEVEQAMRIALSASAAASTNLSSNTTTATFA